MKLTSNSNAVSKVVRFTNHLPPSSPERKPVSPQRKQAHPQASPVSSPANKRVPAQEQLDRIKEDLETYRTLLEPYKAFKLKTEAKNLIEYAFEDLKKKVLTFESSGNLNGADEKISKFIDNHLILFKVDVADWIAREDKLLGKVNTFNQRFEEIRSSINKTDRSPEVSALITACQDLFDETRQRILVYPDLTDKLMTKLDNTITELEKATSAPPPAKKAKLK
jgi:cell fate (sporulation/competence/biofilm development) regulator YlbF (YheA/YmcA/DUF963 family)